MRSPVTFLPLVLALSACVTAGPPDVPAQQAIVRDYVAAYNDRDLDGMALLAHQDIEWLNVEGSTVDAMANGRSDLMAQMTEYVASPQATRSALSDFSVNGSFVAVTETARWTTEAGERREQSAIAVYQIEGGLIRRVWYYPAE